MNLKALRELAATFVAVSAAMGVVLGLCWALYLEPKVESLLLDSEGREAHKFALLADAIANRDTAAVKLYARYGFPQGPSSGAGE